MSQSIVDNEQTAVPVFSEVRRLSQPEPQPREASEHSIEDVWQQLVKEFSFVVPGAIIPDLAARTKEEAIRALTHALAAAGALAPADCEQVTLAVLKREELGTTGMGAGVAIPHTKHPALERVIGAIGHSPAGIDFHSLDDRPVHLIFLLVSPAGVTRDHLLALEAISREIIEPAYAPLRHGAT